MRALIGCSMLVVLVFAGGCARAKITTELKADGGFTRTVELTGQAKQEGGMQMGSSLEETFAIPSGAGWKSKETKKDTDRTLTLTRTFAASAVAKGDLSLREGEGKFLVVNEASVKRTGPGQLEYTETLRWVGEPPKPKLKQEDLKQLKDALPKALATDANAQAVAAKTAELAVPALFGPGDPLLSIGLVHPDLAQRRATQRIGGLVLKALEEQFGDKMTPAMRRAVALKLIDATFSAARPSKPDPAAGPPTGGDSKSAGLTPLMFVLKGPGKVVSSNGEVDELAGDVYWALFPEAASLKPVVLTALWATK